MPGITKMTKLAVTLGPIAVQSWEKLKPRLQAYRAAADIDGYVGTWSGSDGVHYLVFAAPDGEALDAFPPLANLSRVSAAIDRGKLAHHRDLPEHRLRTTVSGVGSRVVATAGEAASRVSRRGRSAQRRRQRRPELPAVTDVHVAETAPVGEQA